MNFAAFPVGLLHPANHAGQENPDLLIMATSLELGLLGQFPKLLVRTLQYAAERYLQFNASLP